MFFQQSAITRFTTGTLRGKVELAETGTVDSTLIVILHKNLNDSAIKKLKPDYYARVDSGGNFRFRFLENGTYNIYVLPNDYSKRYDDSTKMFAFFDKPVTVDDTVTEPIMLYAYNEYKPDKNSNNFSSAANKQLRVKKKPSDTTKSITFNTSLERGTARDAY